MHQILSPPDNGRFFFSKVQQEVRLLSNIQFILEKIEQDGFLGIIRESFEKVFQHEIRFALNELSKLEKRNDNEFDMKSQLTNNTYIFKENLKLIANFASGVNSRASVEGLGQCGPSESSVGSRTRVLAKQQNRRDSGRRRESHFGRQ
jgi:hypothetical protein